MKLDITKDVYINVFDEIEDMAKKNGFACRRFLANFPKLEFDDSFNIIETKNCDVEYIHILREEGDMILSIFYDREVVMTMVTDKPNFEIYDGKDVERFLTNEEDIQELVDLVDYILKGNSIRDRW